MSAEDWKQLRVSRGISSMGGCRNDRYPPRYPRYAGSRSDFRIRGLDSQRSLPYSYFLFTSPSASSAPSRNSSPGSRRQQLRGVGDGEVGVEAKLGIFGQAVAPVLQLDKQLAQQKGLLS